MSNFVSIDLETPFNINTPKVEKRWNQSRKLTTYIYPANIEDFINAMDATDAPRTREDYDAPEWDATGMMQDVRSQLHALTDVEEDYSELLPPLPEGWEKAYVTISVLG